MNDKQRNEPAPTEEQRRQQFAPHHNPKKQPDGDPGPNSPREGAVDERGTQSPESVEDDPAQD
jgi:hypothetical protein